MMSLEWKLKYMGHYVRNYMLYMPFTHRSTLTMNTNGGSRWEKGDAFKTGNINVDYLSLRQKSFLFLDEDDFSRIMEFLRVELKVSTEE
ncbi:CLUMA_CG006862, isoform A [Clunio marinus]|uniref:CLUMA_CG006862, isoform A n=1 Tax=Clunio marinus TaxID=568069 RepID=A0A1J1I4L3_9DIPT|nr:CLUMA_CG006862, isoform A [Clunio marinus]